MKELYPDSSKEKLCGLFGKTRHAYYDRLWRQNDDALQDDIVLQHVLQIREKLPRVGIRKLHYMLKPVLASHGLEIGRDYLFDLLANHKLLIRQRKRKAITTDSRHWMHKYSNLIRDLQIHHPEQLWVSDITYVRLNNQWGYLSLITDAYSRRIMGYCFRTDLCAQLCLDALLMAIQNRSYTHHALIHHSDRGSQYCSSVYVNTLLQNNIAVSMTEQGDPYENALAERMNGIIKNEFNLQIGLTSYENAYALIKENIASYNEIRPHSSCDYLTPTEAHKQEGKLKKRWKKYPYRPREPIITEPQSAYIKEQDCGSVIKKNNHLTSKSQLYRKNRIIKSTV